MRSLFGAELKVIASLSALTEVIILPRANASLIWAEKCINGSDDEGLGHRE
jgi:hypothetical protein